MRLPFTGSFWRQLGDLVLSSTTREGKTFAVAIVMAASISSASLDIPAFHLLSALCALVLVAYVAGMLRKPRLRVRGELAARAVAGEAVVMEFTLENTMRRTAFDVSAGFLKLPVEVRVATEATLVSVLEPGERTTVAVALTTARRGLYELPDVRAFSTFPLNLCRFRAPRNADRPRARPLIVYPHFHPLSAIDVPVSARYQPGGIALSSNVGESPEYIGNRPYRAGDSTRHLDFRAWARLAQPVVREYQEEYYCRLALVLDTYVPGKTKPPREGFPNLEAAVSLSAAIADALGRGEYVIDIFAAGPKLHVFRAGRHTAHFENVLEILAGVDACRSNPFEEVTPALTDELANISTVICVLLDWDEAREGLVRAAIDCGCAVKVILIRDDEPAVPLAHLSDTCDITRYTPAAVSRGEVDAL